MIPDSQGQLLTETLDGTTYTYTYDTYGNIRSKCDGTTTVNYTYGSSGWLDLLTEYNGNPIAYDAIGNPTQWYDGTNFTWVNGRRLAGAVNLSTGLNVSYTYDNAGLRLSKTVNGVEHKYIWNNGKLVSEYYNGTELEFFYDESGCPAAFSYKANTAASPVYYYYLRNLQGDITGIVNSYGSMVANYSYNAWGKLLDIQSYSNGDNIAAINPLRYRGYYYDTDLGLYYLQSRYYDPEVGRFINADAYVSTGQGLLGCNMFAYCGNNPITFNDRSGQSFSFIIGYNMNFFGWGATFSWSFVSTEENWGVQFSYYISEDSDLAELNNQTIGVDTGLYIGVQYTEKNNMDEMTGLSKTTGGDVLLGFDFITDASGEYVGWQFGASTCSFNAHSYYTNTETVFKLPTFNLFKLAKDWIAKEN